MTSASGGFARLAVISALATLAALQPAEAIIVGGTLGTGTNNVGESTLQSYLSSDSLPAFTYWDNLVRVNDASGVYLGYNPSTLRGWVLSAEHIGDPTSINVSGSSYTVISGTQIGSTDLYLFEIGGALGDPALPTLSTVNLAGIAATAGEFALMTGRGYTTSTSYPYPWGSPGATDAIPMRWGTNRVDGTFPVDLDPGPGTNIAQYIITDFDDPIDPGVTAYEGQGAVGDSGGGLFVLRGGQWVLSGIAHFVGDPDDLPTDPSDYDDYTGYSDIYTNLAAINGITGTLVPEPSSALLLPLAGLGLLRRHRRA